MMIQMVMALVIANDALIQITMVMVMCGDVDVCPFDADDDDGQSVW